MITNYLISPHPILQSFVDNYILCTSGDEKLIFGNHWPASHETSLVFHMADKPCHINASKDALLSNKNHCIVGLQTRNNGIVHFNGRYHTFIIQFKANGFNRIFGIPMYELKDKIFSTADVFGRKSDELYDKLLNVVNIQQMALFADSFLLSYIKQNKDEHQKYDGITAVAEVLFNTTHLLKVEHYAQKANMSLRNFERRFSEQAGISPKLYAKLVRFNEALKVKQMEPEKNWTSIAYECGYFDQMHFIKDFKQFAGLNPTDFYGKNDKEIRIHPESKQQDHFNGKQIKHELPQVKLFFVRRTLF